MPYVVCQRLNFEEAGDVQALALFAFSVKPPAALTLSLELFVSRLLVLRVVLFSVLGVASRNGFVGVAVNLTLTGLDAAVVFSFFHFLYLSLYRVFRRPTMGTVIQMAFDDVRTVMLASGWCLCSEGDMGLELGYLPGKWIVHFFERL